MGRPPSDPELARPYFTRQAQLGRRVIFRWDPSDAGPANPLTQPWPALEELIGDVESSTEEAARRFDLDQALGPGGRQPGGDVPDALPCVEFFTWAEAERWLCESES